MSPITIFLRPRSFPEGLTVISIFVLTDCNSKSSNIFIINTEDHQHHVKTVEAFARFLDHHSKCRVIYAPWYLHEYLENKGRWITTTVQNADYIILINSELTLHQNEALKHGENPIWNPTDASLTSDLFMLSVPEIEKNTNSNTLRKTCKKIIVNFDYTPDKYCMHVFNAEFKYHIPTDMNELLSQLQTQYCCQTNLHNDNEFDTTVLLSSTDGKELIQCINTSIYFKKQNLARLNACYGNSDSGFSSPACSIQTAPSSAEQPPRIDDMTFLYSMQNNSRNDLQYQNNLNDGISRSRSVEDNTLVETLFSKEDPYSDTSDNRYSAFSSQPENGFVPPDFFDEPSIVGDDDVLSQQLRREIYELNSRMMKSQMQNGFIARGLSREDEIISLGGQSV